MLQPTTLSPITTCKLQIQYPDQTAASQVFVIEVRSWLLAFLDEMIKVNYKSNQNLHDPCTFVVVKLELPIVGAAFVL